MNTLVGKHVKISPELGLSKQNSVGRVVAQDGPIVYVSNMNMPYQGTLVRKPFTINEIEVIE